MNDLGITKNWFRVGSNNYIKQEHFLFDCQLAKSEIGSRWQAMFYGGFFLRLRRSQKLVIIDIINNQGFMLEKSIVVDIENVHSAFWCHNGTIGIIDYFSCIHIISTYGDVLSVRKPPKSDRIRVAAPFSGGICFVNESYEIVAYISKDNSFVQFGKLDGKNDPIAIDFAGSDNSRGFIMLDNRVLYAFSSKSIDFIDALQFLPSRIQCDPNGKTVGLVHLNTLTSYTIGERSKIEVCLEKDIAYMGFIDDYTIAVSDGKTLAISQVSLPTPLILDISPIYNIAQDIDGIRVYSTYSITINPVPKKLSLTLQTPFSTRLSQLYKAYQQYTDEDIGFYGTLEDLKPYLENIVNGIVDASPVLFDVGIIERLMSVAAFCKYQLNSFDHDKFANVISKVRILNSVRKPFIPNEPILSGCGLLLTNEQFDKMSMNDFVGVLSALKFFDMAGVVSDIYNIDASIVADSWAKHTISNKNSDQNLSQILKNISAYPNVNYLNIAQYAQTIGKPPEFVLQIAKCIRDPIQRIMFLEKPIFEQSILPSLLEIKDGTSILHHLFYVKYFRNKLYENTISSHSIYMDMIICYQRYISIEKLEQMKFMTPNKLSELTIIHTIPPDRYGRDNDQLNAVLKRFEKGSAFPEAIKKHISVNDIVAGISDIHGTGSSPSPRQLMERSLVLGQTSIFDKIAKVYNCDEKTIAFTKVRTYAKYREQNYQLDKFASNVSTKMPLGAFADICISAGLRDKAILFIQRISKNEEKLNKFIEFEMYTEASQIASAMKNPSLAAELMEKAQKK